jgi:hypothetical protein
VLLSRDGSRLKFASYLGGSGGDGSVGAGSWLDGKGNWFVPGFTTSTDFPVTRARSRPPTPAGSTSFWSGRPRQAPQRVRAADGVGHGRDLGAAGGLTQDRIARR